MEDINENPSMHDGIVDQYGGRWIKFGTSEKYAWINLSEFSLNERSVFEQLARAGYTFLKSASKNVIKALVEDYSDYRPGIVADRPGWYGEHVYVMPSGIPIVAPNSATEVILGFRPLPKYNPVGSTGDWQTVVEPLVTNQPLIGFAIAYSMIGPLLKFAPADSHPPQVEFVGEPQSGKTTLGVFAQSIWAGNPASDVGGGNTGNITPGAIDGLKRAHADGLLFIDEATSLITAGNAQQEGALKKVVLDLSSSTARITKFSAAGQGNAAVATLSTSNSSMVGNRLEDADTRALRSRLVTITVPDPDQGGIVSFVPKGFASAGAVVERMRAVANTNYGAPAHMFVDRLVQAVAKDEGAVRKKIKAYCDWFLAELKASKVKGLPIRARKTCALTYAAACLAEALGVFPKAWRVPGSVVATLPHIAREPGSRTANDQMTEYRRLNRHRIIPGQDATRLRRREFRCAAGFSAQKADHFVLVVPVSKFRRDFPGYREVLHELRADGVLKPEEGSRQLSRPAPAKIGENERVYRFEFPDNR